MKSWAHTYLAGSLLGTALIVAALVAFVPLVSLNAPDEWPTPSLGLGGGGSDAGVSSAVAIAEKRSNTAGRGANPGAGRTATADTVVGAVPAPGRELENGRPGSVGTGPPPAETVAVAPAPAEVVARDPAPPAPESVDVAPQPPANPTETGSPPVPATTGGDVGGLGETPPTAPIVAGVGGEGPEPQPPEGTGSQPPEDVGSIPPPSGGPSEDCNAVGSPGHDGEGEEAQSENSEVPAGSARQLEPGSGRPEVAERGLADLALAAPRLVDVAADR